MFLLPLNHTINKPNCAILTFIKKYAKILYSRQVAEKAPYKKSKTLNQGGLAMSKMRNCLGRAKITLPKKFQQFNDERDAYLFPLAQNGNVEALNKLIELNYGLIVYTMNRLLNRKLGDRLEEDDFFHEAVIGLRTAILKYDSSKNIKFSTYASLWIKQALFRAFYLNFSDFHMPVHVFAYQTAFRKHTNNGLGIVGAIEKMALPKLRMEQILKADPKARIVTLRVGNNEAITTNDFPAIDSVADWSDSRKATDNLMHHELTQILQKILSKKEFEIISRRFGLAHNSKYGREETLGKVGKDMGLSRERIRQIEVLAINKLREDERFRDFREYLRE